MNSKKPSFLTTNDPSRYESVLLDYAAGNLCAAMALVVSVHVALEAAAQDFVTLLEFAGGDLMDQSVAVRFDSLSITQSDAHAEHDPSCRFNFATIMNDSRPHLWRNTLPGMAERSIGGVDASILRIKAGGRMPHHGHEGMELTLVLSGVFGDEAGLYQRGALIVADKDLEHRPYVFGSSDCICLTASIGRQIPTGFVQGLLSRMLS